MVLNKCLKQQAPQTYLHMIHFYLMHFSWFKIFNFKKFELKCSIQVKIDIKLYITKNRSYGFKVAFAQ